jgi:PleD family two-component response regulator
LLAGLQKRRNIEYLYQILKNLYTVFKASNGKTALECLQKESIDIVITDSMMPEMNGLQLCSHIKSNVDTSHIPVIMLRAKSDIKSHTESLDVGADAVVHQFSHAEYRQYCPDQVGRSIEYEPFEFAP